MPNITKLSCNFCKTEFKRQTSQITADTKRGRVNVFCSTKCNSSYHKKSRDFCCYFCQNTFSSSYRKAKFCTKSCAAKYNNKLRAKSAPSQKHKKPKEKRVPKVYISMGNITLKELRKKYSLNQFHAKIRGWSRSVYLTSGKIMECAYCKYNLHVDICHIKAVACFEENTEIGIINAADNLVALCKNHHWEFDNNKLSLSSIFANAEPQLNNQDIAEA